MTTAEVGKTYVLALREGPYVKVTRIWTDQKTGRKKVEFVPNGGAACSFVDAVFFEASYVEVTWI